jgi:ATP-binding cassette, subfamily B, multidrug efflux pump
MTGLPDFRQGRHSERSGMDLFWHHLRKHWPKVAIAVVFLAVTDVAQVLVPRQIRIALDGLKSSDVAITDFRNTALTIVSLLMLVALARMAWRLIMWPMSRTVEYELRRQLFKHMQRLDPGYYHHHPSGDLMSRANSDVEAIRVFFSMGFVVFFDVIFVTAMALWMMLQVSWEMTLAVAVPIMVAPVFSIALTKRLSRAFKESQDELGILSGRAQEDIIGTRVLKTYAREDAAGLNYTRQNLKTRDKFLAVSRIWSLIGPYFHLVPQVAVLILGVVCSTVWMSGRHTLGEIMEMQQYAFLLSWPTFALGWGITMLTRMRASLARVKEVLDEPQRERADISAGADEVRGELAFRGLTFGYNGGEPVLDDFALEISAGEIVGVTGPTGSGKSTMLSLAVNLVESPRGSVFLDGVDVRDVAPEKLRRHIALVQQTPYLFSRSLSENLSFARPDADLDDIHEAVRVAGLQPDMRQFEEGLDTLVGDRGVTLSGGQRLRVALGRALLAQPRVLLLDDAFSAVDVQTEEVVWSALRERMAGRTVVVVSHRISVLRRCDRIAVIEGGRVSELGTHHELLGREGFYARTFALQELFER